MLDPQSQRKKNRFMKNSWINIAKKQKIREKIINYGDNRQYRPQKINSKYYPSIKWKT